MATHCCTSRAYCRVVMWSPCRHRLGKSQSSLRRPRIANQEASASRVGSVISNGTGRPVFCWTTVARWRREPPGATSLTRSFTRSQPRSLASIPQSNKAKSRTRPVVLSCCRIAQTCLGLNGCLGPMIRPEFQGRGGERNKSSCAMVGFRRIKCRPRKYDRTNIPARRQRARSGTSRHGGTRHSHEPSPATTTCVATLTRCVAPDVCACDRRRLRPLAYRSNLAGE